MKIKTILTGILMLMLTNCGEDFLYLENPASLTTSTYFTTPADFESAVNGIYAQLRGFHNNSYLQAGSMHSDEARYYYNPELRANLGSEYLCDFVPQYSTFSSYWNTFYGWIARANDIVSRIDDVEFTDQDQKDNLKGQALFMRAYAYWWVWRLYGTGVIHTEPVVTLEETMKALSTGDQIVAQVITDATAAASLLPSKGDQDAGRVTSGTANLLLGEVYIWQEEWAAAEDALSEMLDDGYELLPDYASVFDVNNKNNDESVFEIQYLSPDYDCGLLYWSTPSPMLAEDIGAIMGTDNPQSTTSQSWLAPTPDLINKFDQVNDDRFDVTIKYVHYEFGMVPMQGKWVHQHAKHGDPDNNFMVYRYAEALLFLAEAINEQPGNRQTEALGYLNQVRTRGGLLESEAVTQDEVREAIRAERTFELALEGKRWWDLRRWGIYWDVITEYGENVMANPLDYYLVGGATPASGAFTDDRELFNLPEDETMPNLEIQ